MNDGTDISATVATVSPVPTDEEAAAIVAATEALWPRATELGPPASPRNTAWRFSSRSWNRPLPVRRLRPWR